MSLYKRKSTWWTDFSVNGQRYRESLDTTDWREAQAKAKEPDQITRLCDLGQTAQLVRDATGSVLIIPVGK